MPAKAIQILVIDDDPIFRGLARVMLETAGYAVQEAVDGSYGIARYRQLGIDLVITDIVMPRMEGFETILELRRIDPDVRIIAVTAADPMFLTSAERFGAVRSLCKPISRDGLLTTVSEVLATQVGVSPGKARTGPSAV